MISDSGHTGVALLECFGAIADFSQNDRNIAPKYASDDESRNGHPWLKIQRIDECNARFRARKEPPGSIQHFERARNAIDVYTVWRRVVEAKFVIEARQKPRELRALAEYLCRPVFERFEQLAFLHLGHVFGSAFAVFKNRPYVVDCGFYSDGRADRSVEASTVAKIKKNLTRVET